MKEVTIIITTYKRVEGLKRIINSINIMYSNVKYKFLIAIDNNDIDTYKYCCDNNLPCFE